MAIQARTEFASAINQIASEKGVDVDVILTAIKSAALAAYRKDLSYRNEPIPDDFEELEAKIDPVTGEIGVYRGEENITPPGFARIAAQTAKQVIAQKLHEAEKGAIFDEYEQKVGSVISGSIRRQEGNTYFIDLGRAEGIFPPSEQVRNEFYSQNQRLKFLIKEIRETSRGPEVVVSRTDPKLVAGLFASEVPEIQTGAVEIKEIAREAGARTKVAVASTQEGVDPVGSLVGQKGVRVQAVITELGEEKIDIIQHSADTARFIASALSPAKDLRVELDEDNKVAKVKVPESQFSLAIGKGGQNVRLAAKLTGWKIDMVGAEGEAKERVSEDGAQVPTSPTAADPTTGTTTSADDLSGTEKQIENDIDEATEKAAIVDSLEPEPTAEEAAVSASDAEADVNQEDLSSGSPRGSMEESESADRGDILSSGAQSDTGVSDSTVDVGQAESEKGEK